MREYEREDALDRVFVKKGVRERGCLLESECDREGAFASECQYELVCV